MSGRKRPPRLSRLVATLVVFGVLGAVASVAVAWGCARYSRFRLPEPTDGRIGLVSEIEPAVSDNELFSMFERRGMGNFTMRTGPGSRHNGFGAQSLSVGASDGRIGGRAVLYLLDTGWPMLALRTE